MENMDGYSLGDIIENFGSLNENLLQKIACQLLNSLGEFEEMLLEDYGDICPCNILFNKYGIMKVCNKFKNFSLILKF